MAQQRLDLNMPPQNISPFTMPPPELNTTIPQGISAQLARSHVRRRPSTKSNTPNSSRRASAKITKYGAVGNSPHNVQRRRTTAIHPTREHAVGNPYMAREQTRWNNNDIRHSMPEMRPFSWHPGSDLVLPNQGALHSGESFMGNTIEGLENLAVTNTPPSVEQSIQDAFTMGYGYPLGLPTSTANISQQNLMSSHSILNADPANQTLPHDIPSFDFSGSAFSLSGQDLQFSGHVPVHHGYYPPQDSIISNVPSKAPQPVSQELPAKEFAALQSKTFAETPEEGGEELIGIGLYDDECPRRANTSGPTATNPTLRISVGQDLKLEETWQPPLDEESSDDAEEADELPVIGSSAPEAQPALYNAYSDLSNQSFFLNDDDDDPYVTGDQFVNPLALDDSGFATLQPWKAQPAGAGHFAYF